MGREKRNFVLLMKHSNMNTPSFPVVWGRTRWMEWRGRHAQEYADQGIDIDEKFLLARGSKRKMQALHKAWDNLMRGD